MEREDGQDEVGRREMIDKWIIDDYEVSNESVSLFSLFVFSSNQVLTSAADSVIVSIHFTFSLSVFFSCHSPCLLYLKTERNSLC